VRSCLWSSVLEVIGTQSSKCLYNRDFLKNTINGRNRFYVSLILYYIDTSRTEFRTLRGLILNVYKNIFIITTNNIELIFLFHLLLFGGGGVYLTIEDCISFVFYTRFEYNNPSTYNVLKFVYVCNSFLILSNRHTSI